ncbi:MAG: isoleucine--tRNA ligase [Hyphomonadaceae bacterium]|nr:isoleucine--tRNA ligase [Hyphomonadaceae bacterium]
MADEAEKARASKDKPKEKSEGRDYRETLFLPETPFPMKAGLPQKEPQLLDYWREIDLYRKLRDAAASRPKFTLHDGPPYANGPIHIGHAENKILKDLVVRTHQMMGFDSDYVPGWDCHGLPIEWKVEEDFRSKGKKKQDVPAVEFRRACRAYADKWIPLQRTEFQRLGIEGDWEKYYTTMSFEAEAAIAAEFLKVVRTGLVYRGSKPVMWSPVERTSLAEAEVEYQDKVSPTIWVKFPIVALDGEPLGLADKLANTSIVIWTTTPWTIPGNRAISYSPREDVIYSQIEVEEIDDAAFKPWARVGDRLIIASNLIDATVAAAKISKWKPLGVIGGRGNDLFSRMTCAHPLRDWRPSPLAGEGGEGGRSGEGAASAKSSAPPTPTPNPSPQGGGESASSAHGWYGFLVPLLAGDHVTDDAGTGFVHTAPGHGQDDFAIWIATGHSQKDIPFTVDEEGAFTKEAPGFEGLHIIELEGKKQGKDGPANEAVIKALIEANALLARGRLEHSYPHSWRSKAPLIFRNTPQWFIALDKQFRDGKTLREIALSEIERVDWGQKRVGDEGGYNRIKGMIAERPDWLISRQRAWGVPLAMFVNKHTGAVLQDDAVDARILAAMKKNGADAWWATPAEQFLGKDHKAADYEKVEDILDVWFDSGCTHAFVLETKPSLKRPADVYLEGSDQHRGWFHSSLLEGCATRGRAPYDSVVTHGFVVAEDGRKMSKSLGNGVEPMDVAKQYGIEILRLLIAQAAYEDDLRMGKTIIDQSAEAYRKLRNTLRFLLGALNGLTDEERLFPPPHAGEASRAKRATEGAQHELPLLERWLLHRLRELDDEVRDAYKRFQYRRAVSALVEFCNVDLSAFYLDVRKDALYCDRLDSPRRRACRTALDETFRRLAVWLAPILPFTMEEVWRTRFPEAASVHLELFPATPKEWRVDAVAAEVAHLRRVRSVVTGALEVARREKKIGSSLEAAPRVFIADPALLNPVKTVDLAELCITSDIVIEAGEGPKGAFHLPEVPGVWVIVEPAQGKKCARSWKISPDIGKDARYPDLTPRDADAVAVWDAAHGR